MTNLAYAVVTALTSILLLVSVPLLWPVYAGSDDSESSGSGSSSDSQQGSSNSGNDLAGKIIVKGGCYLLTKLPQCLSLHAQGGN